MFARPFSDAKYPLSLPLPLCQTIIFWSILILYHTLWTFYLSHTQTDSFLSLSIAHSSLTLRNYTFLSSLSLSHTPNLTLFLSHLHTISLSLSRSLRLSLSSYFSLLQTLTLLSLSLKHTCIHSISNKQSIGISLSSQCSHSSISLTHAALSLSHSNTLYLSFSRGQTPFSYPYT